MHSAPQQKPRPLPLFLKLLGEQTAGDPERATRALEGLRAYQEAPRPPRLPAVPALAERHGAVIRDYGGNGPALLFVPSLINPPDVLDLAEDKSLLRWLAANGHRTLLLDWGTDAMRRRSLSVSGHVEEILLPLMDEIGEAPALAGYCLGGTMALAAAARTRVRALVTIAAPWHFAGYPEPSRAMLLDLWSRVEPITASLGVMPMEALQSAFWSLDPARTIAKFEAFARMDPAGADSLGFVALEDWANDGPPLPEAAARELFGAFIRDDLPGRGQWRVAGEPVDPSALTCPFLNIVSTTDRIVPGASAPQAGERLDLARGHVGMVVGGKARQALWEPLSAWLSQPASGC